MSDAKITALTKSLKVKRHHLATDIPEKLRHIVRAVHPCAFGVDSAQLVLVVPGQVLLRINAA